MRDRSLDGAPRARMLVGFGAILALGGGGALGLPVERMGVVAASSHPRVSPRYLADPEATLDLQPIAAFPSHAPCPVGGSSALPSAAASPGWRVHRVRSGDTLAAIFQGQGLSATELHRVLSAGPETQVLRQLRPGATLRLQLDPGGDLLALSHEPDPTRQLLIRRTAGGFQASVLTREPITRERVLSGTIDSSLYAAGRQAGLSDAQVLALADIFRWDIDFALEVQPGDRFSLVFAEDWLDGTKLRDGPILAAEFVNRGQIHRAVRFQDAGAPAEYFTPDGQSLRKAFLRAPVDFWRVTSRFQQNRWHPILGVRRPHRGVDYAAAVGTPVVAAGKGQVVSLGAQPGYGNSVLVQHGSQYRTLYAHLRRFAAGLKVGDPVTQGQLVGYVGQTGLATGPHLHYEFQVDGVHRDPQTVESVRAESLAPSNLPRFRAQAEPLLARLETLGAAVVARVP